MRLLVVYAVEEERVDVPFSGEIFYVKTGIGKVKAAIKVQSAIAEIKPDFVLNIGTAGSVKHSVGEIVVCNKFFDRDLEKVNHPEITSRLEFDKKAIHDFLPGIIVDDYSCGTGDSFLVDAQMLYCDVCDMEAFAVAMVCDYFKVPFAAVKYVSDKVGENKSKQWEETLAGAKKGLSDFFHSVKS